MSIQITPEVEQLVHGIYATGQYASETEVLAAAVRMLHNRQQLRMDLEQGSRELDNGQRIDAELLFAELRAKAAKLDEHVE